MLAFIAGAVMLHLELGWLRGRPVSTGSFVDLVLLLIAGVFGYFAFLAAEIILNRPRIHRFLFEDVRDWKLPRP